MSGKGWEMSHLPAALPAQPAQGKGLLEPQLGTDTGSWGWLQEKAQKFRSKGIHRQDKCRCWRLQILPHRQHHINIRTKILQAQKELSLSHANGIEISVMWFISLMDYRLLFQAFLAGTISKPYQFNKGEDRQQLYH